VATVAGLQGGEIGQLLLHERQQAIEEIPSHLADIGLSAILLSGTQLIRALDIETAISQHAGRPPERNPVAARA
jgi:hypothetical protein